MPYEHYARYNVRNVRNDGAPGTAPGKTEITKLPPADGVVRITPLTGGRYLVEIGRGKYTKRFQLDHAEASQLYTQLPAMVPGLRHAS